MTCLGTKKRLLRRELAKAPGTRHAQGQVQAPSTGIRYAEGLEPGEAYDNARVCTLQYRFLGKK